MGRVFLHVPMYLLWEESNMAEEGQPPPRIILVKSYGAVELVEYHTKVG